LERMALALIEREVLDGAEVKLLMDGKDLPARALPAKPADGVQQVLKPEPGRAPKGGESPATA
jgi:cell division protease FtsH